MLRLSSRYMCIPRPNCFKLLRHLVWVAFCLALLKAGSRIEARIAIMAITTSNSIKVKARRTTPLHTPEIRVFMELPIKLRNSSTDRERRLQARPGSESLFCHRQAFLHH